MNLEQYAVIGRPIGHSLSPLLHRLMYEQTGYGAEYSRFDVDPTRIDEVVPAMRVLGVRGFNVTSPHKERIVPYMDELSPTAQQIGAVNTVLLREDGTAFGDNTDSYGFTQTLRKAGIGIEGARFVLCGQSGAGKAVMHALEAGGAAELLVASTRAGQGISYDALATLDARDVIINCTPVGMTPHPERSVVDAAVLARFSAAVDLIYHPVQTTFLRIAQEQGKKTVNGLWMLIYQGLRSFSIWTGQEPEAVDTNKLYTALRNAL